MWLKWGRASRVHMKTEEEKEKKKEKEGQKKKEREKNMRKEGFRPLQKGLHMRTSAFSIFSSTEMIFCGLLLYSLKSKSTFAVLPLKKWCDGVFTIRAYCTGLV